MLQTFSLRRPVWPQISFCGKFDYGNAQLQNYLFEVFGCVAQILSNIIKCLLVIISLSNVD